MRQDGKTSTPIGDVLRWIREDYLGGIGQTQLSQMLGVVQSYVAMMERGRRALSPKRLRDIARALAKVPEDEEKLRRMLLVAYLKTKDPEGARELELVHLRPVGEEDAPDLGDWAKRVKTAMSRGGWTADRLAEEIGVSADYLEEALKGRMSVPRHEVKWIAKALEEDPQEHLVFAGYIPEDASRVLPDVAGMLGAATQMDERTKSVLDFFFRRVAATAKAKQAKRKR
jgi:transcriptional regulator with XRE-family HTH domain